MPRIRNWSKAVPEGKSPVSRPGFGRDEPTLADIDQLFQERLDRQPNRMKSYFDELTKKMIETRRRSASIEQDAWKQRLATEVDVSIDTKNRKRMEDVAAERVISGDDSSAEVDPDPMCLTSFGDDSTQPPPLPCSRDGALVANGASRQSRVSYPRKCARKQPPLAYSLPAQPLQRRWPSFTSRLFGSIWPKR